MTDALTVTQIGLMNDMLKMQAISHNLANVGTTGYKKNVVSVRAFNDVLQANAGVPNMAVLEAAASLPSLRVTSDTSPGSFKHTGNPLDLALETGQYLEVMTRSGPAYTRQGNLRIDPESRLVTLQGQPIIGEEGEIMLNGGDPVIRQSGEIRDGDELIGHLRVVEFARPDALQSIGSGLYVATNLSDTPTPVLSPNVRQGYVEASNVLMMDEMVRMMETVRHFEAGNNVVKGYDRMLESAINILGEF